MAVQLLFGPYCIFSSLILYTVSRTPWTEIRPSQGRYLDTRQHSHKINTHTHTHRHSCLEWDSKQRPSVWTGEDTSRHRPRGHCDQFMLNTFRWRSFVLTFAHVSLCDLSRDYMKQSDSWEANNFSAAEESLHMLSYPWILCCVHPDPQHTIPSPSPRC
jgi:hypothetical protein